MKTLLVFHNDGGVTKFYNVQFAMIYPTGAASISWIDIDGSEHITSASDVNGFAWEE